VYDPYGGKSNKNNPLSQFVMSELHDIYVYYEIYVLSRISYLIKTLIVRHGYGGSIEPLPCCCPALPLTDTWIRPAAG
jgi:hypothetical protein